MVEGSKAGKRYSQEFKLQASKLVVEGGYTYVKAADRLGVSVWSLRDWVRSFREQGELAGADERVPLAEELKALRKELVEVRLENDILKKAAAYFAKESL
jgi:transposase